MLHSDLFSFVLVTICRFVLDQILCGEATESVVENIHEYLSTIGKDVRDGKIPLDEFIIYKVRSALCLRKV